MSLKLCFSLTASVNELDTFFFLDAIQLADHFFKMFLLDLSAPDLSQTVCLYTFLYQQCHLIQKLCLVLGNGFLPYESVFIGIGLDLGPVDEYLSAAYLAKLHEVVNTH